MTKNELAFNKLAGKGLELGALHNPVLCDMNKATVLYADRLTKKEAIYNFPELEGEIDKIIEPDILLNLDKDDLSIIHNQNFDFVIANHVIEHVVNPIRFLKQLSDNLKTNGRLLLTVPNKDFTHDRNRKLTRYRHLVFEYLIGVRSLSNSHIRDYLLHKMPVTDIHPRTVEHFVKNGLPLTYYKGNQIPHNPIMRRRLFNYHRTRSIHVHVWNRESFDFFLRRTIDLFRLNFTVEYYLSQDVSPGEMIYLLTQKPN